MVEQLVLVGVCAFAGITALYRYGHVLDGHLRAQADRIEGKDLPVDVQPADWIIDQLMSGSDDWSVESGLGDFLPDDYGDLLGTASDTSDGSGDGDTGGEAEGDGSDDSGDTSSGSSDGDTGDTSSGSSDGDTGDEAEGDESDDSGYHGVDK